MYPERGAWCSCWLRVSHEGANHQQGLWSLEAVEHTRRLTHGPVPGPLHWLPGVLTLEQPASPGASTPGGRVSERGSHRCCPAFRSHTATSSCPWSAPAAPGQRGGDCSGSGAPGGQAPGHLAADSHRASSPTPLCLSVPPPQNRGAGSLKGIVRRRSTRAALPHIIREFHGRAEVSHGDCAHYPSHFRHLKTLSFHLHGSELLRAGWGLTPSPACPHSPQQAPSAAPWVGVPGSP